MTSNYPPGGLWPNGLLRERFLPAIRLIEQSLDVVEVDGGIDYRLRALEQAASFRVPAGPAADAGLDRAFDAMCAGPDESPHLVVERRKLVARRVAGGAAWFDFAALCDGPRSQRDYLELARRFPVLFLSGIPVMSAQDGDRARRFTWLIDILYDHRVKLLASAEAAAEQLYVAGPHAQEFPRTVSRLAEMRTREYMALPHAAGDAVTAVAV
jgi:cell division protein ZapE